MSSLKKWGVLYEFYKATHRAAIIESLYKRPLSESWPYWSALVIYLIVSAVAYSFGRTPLLYLPSMFVILVTAFFVYIWLEFKIAKDFESHYECHSLKRHPFFSRTKYLSYLLFVEKLNGAVEFAKSDIDFLVEWENIRQERTNTSDFFKTPGVLLILTIFSGLFIEYLKVNTKYIVIILILITVALWVGWIVSDSLKSQKKKNLEICRFLKWWELDK